MRNGGESDESASTFGESATVRVDEQGIEEAVGNLIGEERESYPTPLPEAGKRRRPSARVQVNRGARRHWRQLEAKAAADAQAALAAAAAPALPHRLSEQLMAMQARGVPRAQICRALGLSETLAEAYGLGRAAPTPDPFGNDPRSASCKRRTPSSRTRARGRRQG